MIIPGVAFQPGDVYSKARLTDGRPIPKYAFPGYTVPELWIQILFATRAILLALIDASGALCTGPDGYPDRDYIGNLSGLDVFGAIDKMATWSLTRFVPLCKYWKDYPLASCLANPLPVVPLGWDYKPDEPLFTGKLASFWRRLCHPLPDGPVAASLFRACFSIAQSKKGFHPVPESFVTAAYLKHANILSKPPPGKFDPVDLRKFLNSFLRNFEPKNLLRQVGTTEATNNASNVHTRKMGGNRSDVVTQFADVLNAPSDGLVRMLPSDSGIVTERGTLPPTTSEWEYMLSRPIDYRYETLPGDVIHEIPDEWKDRPFAMVRGITEPLKVRTITSMIALSTYASKPLQKALWHYLRKFPCFALIGEPFHEGMVTDLLEKHLALHGPDSEWDFVSGDYSSATDLLDIDATKLVLETVIDKCSEEDAVLEPHYRAIIHEQVLVYPEDTAPPTLQTNGQLMGSIPSFPFLCILNLYTFFKSLTPAVQDLLLKGKLSWKSLPVLINGDDILFRASIEQYERWAYESARLGFELSLGKNFVHKRFFTVNSLPLEFVPPFLFTRPPLFTIPFPLGKSWVDLDEMPSSAFESSEKIVPGTVIIHGFMNVGLLVGLSKTALSVREDSVPLSGWFSGAVIGSMYPEKATNFFLNYHHDEICKQTSFGKMTLNIYAHPFLGGLGFPVPYGVTPHFSEAQRHLAARLLFAAHKEFYGSPSLHPLKPFAYLQPSELVTKSLGNRPGYVRTYLGSPTGPYLEDQSPFADNTTIHATPLAMVYGDLDQGFLNPTCRLSNSELGRLLKSLTHRSRMVDVPDMTVFPYRIITRPLETIVAPGSPSEEPTIPTLPMVQPEPEFFETQRWESWEFPVNPHLEGLRTFKLRSLKDVLHFEGRAVQRAQLRASKSERRNYIFNMNQ